MLPLARFFSEAVGEGAELAGQRFSVEEFVGVHAGEWDFGRAYQAFIARIEVVYL